MLVDPPADYATRLTTEYNAWMDAQRLQPPNALMVSFTRKRVDKTLDLCSVELGVPTTPRPEIVLQDDATLKLLYNA
jgi:hypothetical protein